MSRSDQEKMVLVHMHLKPSHPWEYCPRTALRRVAMTLEEEFGLVLELDFLNVDEEIITCY